MMTLRYPHSELDDMQDRKDIIDRINKAIIMLEKAIEKYNKLDYNDLYGENSAPYVIGFTNTYVNMALNELTKK